MLEEHWEHWAGSLRCRWGVSPIAPSRRAGVGCATAHLGTVLSPWGPVGAAGWPPPGEGMFSVLQMKSFPPHSLRNVNVLTQRGRAASPRGALPAGRRHLCTEPRPRGTGEEPPSCRARPLSSTAVRASAPASHRHLLISVQWCQRQLVCAEPGHALGFTCCWNENMFLFLNFYFRPGISAFLRCLRCRWVFAGCAAAATSEVSRQSWDAINAQQCCEGMAGTAPRCPLPCLCLWPGDRGSSVRATGSRSTRCGAARACPSCGGHLLALRCHWLSSLGSALAPSGSADGG